MLVIRHCQDSSDYSSAAQLAAELAEWDMAETQKLGISSDEMNRFYYPDSLELPGTSSAVLGVMLLALSDSMPAACIGYRQLRPQECEMKRLYVRPSFRGTGLGKTMIASLVKFAATAGYSRMWLETARFMRSAMALYEQAGFVTCAPYYEVPDVFREVSVFMRKDIAAT